jgi:hypothetical protein
VQHQLGKTLSAADAKAIAKRLTALTGDIPTEYIGPPVFPKSTAKTPSTIRID